MLLVHICKAVKLCQRILSRDAGMAKGFLDCNADNILIDILVNRHHSLMSIIGVMGV